ncbi:hypothetical protein, partial [Desulfocastanea catecholica]
KSLSITLIFFPRKIVRRVVIELFGRPSSAFAYALSRSASGSSVAVTHYPNAIIAHSRPTSLGFKQILDCFHVMI